MPHYAIAKVFVAGLVLLGIWTLGVRAIFRTERLEVRAEMASDTAAVIQLFVDDGRGFREALSNRVDVAGDGRFATYRLALTVDRPIRALRLDPLNAPGRCRIRAIRVDFAGRRERFDGPRLADWRPDHQLSSNAGDGFVELLSQGTDPRLVLSREMAGAPWWARPAQLEELVLTALAVPFLVLMLGWGLPRRWAHGLALLTPFGIFLVVNLRALDAWWIHDDPCLLASALTHGAAAHFFDPQVWRGLSGSVLMPWTIFSLSVDEALFGLAPAAFYAHQLVAFGVLLAVAYALVWRFLGERASCLALVLFALSTPSYAVAQRLMNRHYLEGLTFFLVSLALYLRSVRTGHPGFAAAGAGLYLLATTAKEVFVPLVAVLPFLPVGEWRSRLRSTWPFAAAAALYAAWRLFMLGPGNSLSGYAAKSDRPALVDQASILSAAGLEPGWQLILALCVLAGALLVIARRQQGWLVLCGVVAVVLAVPLVGVLREAWPRYFFLPAFGASVLIGSALGPWLTPRREVLRRAALTGVGLALVLFALHALTRSAVWRGHGEAVERHRREGLFVLESPREGVLLTRLADPKYLSCLAEIRDTRTADGGPGFCGDACWCTGAFLGATFWHDVGGHIAPAEPPAAVSCAEERDLEVDMRYDREAGRLAWRLGPHSGTRGAYTILLVTGDRPDVSAPAPLASSGEAALALAEPLRYIVRYRSSAGWQTYSPILTLDPAAGRARWRRPAVVP